MYNVAARGNLFYTGTPCSMGKSAEGGSQELVARHSAQAGASGGDGAVLGLLVCGDDVAAQLVAGGGHMAATNLRQTMATHQF